MRILNASNEQSEQRFPGVDSPARPSCCDMSICCYLTFPLYRSDSHGDKNVRNIWTCRAPLSHPGRAPPTLSQSGNRWYSVPGVAGLDSKWVRWDPNGTNPGLFQIRFQDILSCRAKMYWIHIWKSSGVFPFEANLTNFAPNSDNHSHPLRYRYVTKSKFAKVLCILSQCAYKQAHHSFSGDIN